MSSFQYVLDALLFATEDAGKRPATVENYCRRLTPYVAWLDEQGINYEDLQGTHPLGFLAQLRKQHPDYQPATVRMYKVAMRRFHNFGAKIIRDFPKVSVEVGAMPRNGKHPIITDEEWSRIWDVIETPYSKNFERTRAMLKISRDGWLRLSELQRLNWGDARVSEHGPCIVLRPDGSKDPQQRGGDTVWLSDDCWEAVETYRAHLKELEIGTAKDDPFFVNENTGKRLTVDGISQAFSRVACRAEVYHLTPHGCRHSGALRGMHGIGRPRMSAKAVQMQLRHATIGMTFDCYGIPQDDVQASAMRQAFAEDGLNGNGHNK